MYGVVNQAIQELIITNFGPDNWQLVLLKSGVQEEFFLSNEAYDDDITYKLANAASIVLNMSIKDVLNAFGEFWVLNTGKKKYGAFMSAGGNNLKEFIENLPVFHNRLILIYNNLQPPEFKISNITENSIHLHYFSHRPGLTEFVRGLLNGLSILYNTTTQIELINCRENGYDHDEFKISW